MGCLSVRGPWSKTICALSLHEHEFQNGMFCEENLGKIHSLYVHLRFKDAEPFPERVGPRIILLESLPNKQSSGSFLLDKK